MKKMWLIVASIVLIALIGMNLLTVKTTAASVVFTNQKCGEEAYATLDENGVLTISGTGDTWDFRIEDDMYMDTYGVAPWADCKDAIKKVVFTEKVTSIGAEAFYGCDNLTEVTFNEHLEKIGHFAFWRCSNLETINWSTGLDYIGQQAFAETALVNVSIPDGVHYIDACVFEYCTKLEKVYIGSLSGGMFINGNSLFRGCSKLEEITVSEEHFAFMSIDGVLYLAEKNEKGEKYPVWLQDYPTGKKDKQYTLPETVTTIGDRAVASNPYLETVVLHNNLQRMRMTFYELPNLKNLTIPSSVVDVYDVGLECQNLQWLKNDSNCDIPLAPYAGWRWYDENENEISVIKAKSTVYCKQVIEGPEGDYPEDTSEEPTTSDNAIEETTTSSESNTTPSKEDNSTEETTTFGEDNTTPSREDNSIEETTTFGEDNTTPSREETTTSDEGNSEPSGGDSSKPTETQTTDVPLDTPTEGELPTKDNVIESDKIVEVYKEQAEEDVKGIELIINQPTVVDKTLFENISKLDKDVVIGVVDANNVLQYSWTFSKNAIKNPDANIDLEISFEVEKKTEIEEKIGNKNSKYMEFSHSGELASATTISVYVGDTYSDGEKLYLYYYDEEAKEVLMVGDTAIEVKDGYVAYTITHCSIYFMDKEKFDVALDSNSLKDASASVKDLIINNGQYEIVEKEETKEEPTTSIKENVTEEITTNSINDDNKKDDKFPMWIIIIVGVLVVGGAVALIVYKKKQK